MYQFYSMLETNTESRHFYQVLSKTRSDFILPDLTALTTSKVSHTLSVCLPLTLSHTMDWKVREKEWGHTERNNRSKKGQCCDIHHCLTHYSAGVLHCRVFRNFRRRKAQSFLKSLPKSQDKTKEIQLR